jgi:hypothetical protein
MSLAAIAVSLWDKFNDKLYRPLRAGKWIFSKFFKVKIKNK